MIRIVVAEDHNLVREGICKLLEEQSACQVVGEADNGRDAVNLVKLLNPDVLVLDLAMPQWDGFETLRQVKASRPAPQVVILSMHSDLALVEQALLGGAIGYVLKQSMPAELLTAVQAAASGSVYLSSGVSQVLTQRLFPSHSQNPLDRLSPRERQVVERIVEGCSTREIAEELRSSIKTVEKQRRDAMRKLNVENIAGLVRICLSLGFGVQAQKQK